MLPTTPLPRPAAAVRPRRRGRLVGLALLAAVAGFVVLRPFDVGAATPPSAEQALFGPARTPEERLAWRADLYADLGAELGVAADDVDRAMTTVLADRVDAQVSAGRLSREQADELLAQWEAGELADTMRARFRERLEALGGHLPLGGD
jgi:hypothetical protein